MMPHKGYNSIGLLLLEDYDGALAAINQTLHGCIEHLIKLLHLLIQVDADRLESQLRWMLAAVIPVILDPANQLREVPCCPHFQSTSDPSFDGVGNPIANDGIAIFTIFADHPCNLLHGCLPEPLPSWDSHVLVHPEVQVGILGDTESAGSVVKLWA